MIVPTWSEIDFSRGMDQIELRGNVDEAGLVCDT